MTPGDALIGLGFVGCFGLIHFFVQRSAQLDAHLREQHNVAWKTMHRMDPRGMIFALRFFLFFGWRDLGPDSNVRAFLRDMLYSYAACMALIVVIVSLGATLPLKIFHYVPAKDGIGGSVVLDSDDR